MKNLLIRLLSSETENELLEFKRAERQFDKDKLGRYFSALSNEANLNGFKSAFILFGINNDKSIHGTEISEKQLNEYKLEISNHTSPSVNFRQVHRLTTEEGKVIILEIPAAPMGMPVSWKGHYYARNGESLTGLSIEKIERIRNQNQNDWSKGIINEATISDLDDKAIQLARKQFAEKNPHLKTEISAWDDKIFLNKAKLTIDGKITRTAILLLGKAGSDVYLNPASSKVSWILKDRDGIEKDYQHFFCPLLLEVENVFAKIRNLKYRYMQEGTLFPEEVDQFEPYLIREALNNCIAHQDYRMGGKINIVEREDGVLIFANSGSFIPGSVEKVIEADAPETEYRNPFLSNAMVNLNMIDTIGSGIKKMFMIQKNKFFPLPEYEFSNNKVLVSFTGKVLDINYARKLAQMPDLSLHEIMLLDKVQKRKGLNKFEFKTLKSKNLIEGRKPNYYISASVAGKTGQQSDYIKLRGIEEDFIVKLIIDYLKEFPYAKKSDLFTLLDNKFPDVLNEEQKQHKLKNILQKMKSNNQIDLNEKRKWFLKK